MNARIAVVAAAVVALYMVWASAALAIPEGCEGMPVHTIMGPDLTAIFMTCGIGQIKGKEEQGGMIEYRLPALCPEDEGQVRDLRVGCTYSGRPCQETCRLNGWEFRWD